MEITDKIKNLLNSEEDIYNHFDNVHDVYINNRDKLTSPDEKNELKIKYEKDVDFLHNQIVSIQEARNELYKTLNDRNEIYTLGIANSRVNLVNQLTMLNFLEENVKKMRDKYNNLNNSNNTKKRLFEINTYYSKRYEYQTHLFKKVIIFFIIIIIINILKRNGLIPDLIYKYVNGIIIGVGAFILMFDMWDLHTRSHMNFDEYNWKYETPHATSPGIWEYNKKNFLKMENPIKLLLKNLDICIDDSCCDDGLYFDEQKVKCVTKKNNNSETFISGNGLNGHDISKQSNTNTKTITGYVGNSSFANVSNI